MVCELGPRLDAHLFDLGLYHYPIIIIKVKGGGGVSAQGV